MKRLTWLIIPALTLSVGASPALAESPVVPSAPVAPAPVPTPKPFIQAASKVTPLAQGLTLTTFERLYATGWLNGWLLQADLANPAITTDLVTAASINKGEPLSELATKAGAVAAINGDFFDIGQTGIALGNTVRGGEFIQSGIPTWPLGAGVSKEGIGRLVQVSLQGAVTLPGGQSYPLGAVNLPTVPAHTIGLFTSGWTIARQNAMVGASEAYEVIVRGGKVVSVSNQVTAQPVPADGYVLVGREEFAKPLGALKVGDKVDLTYKPSPDLQWAIGGMRYLVAGGKVTPGLDDRQAGPRSALGFADGGKKMLLLAVDGRSGESGGLTLYELAEVMRSFGATEVLELDGGGSTNLVARLPGQKGPAVLNRPSDGRERLIPNGIGIFATPGSGIAKSLALEGEARVFPGLSRRINVTAYDEQYGAAPIGSVIWAAQGAGSVSADGLFRAPTTPGRVNLLAAAQPVLPKPPEKAAVGLPQQTAPAQAILGQISLQVLGDLARIELVGEGLGLSLGTSGTFAIRGYDHEGFSAMIDPADLTFEYDAKLLRVEPGPAGVTVTALQQGAGLIKVMVQGKEAYVPFVSAQATTVLPVFDQLSAWGFARFPDTVTGALRQAPGREGNGLKLSYTFGEGGNRAAYVQAAPQLELPGKPEAVGLWVKGDGKGAWLRAILVDAKGVNHTLNLARHVDWTDWRYVEAPVPAGVTYPVKLYRVYPVETDATKQYSGELIFDELTVKSPVPAPPAPPTPEQARVDMILQPKAPASEGSWSFAVLANLGQPSPAAPQPPGAPTLAEQEAQQRIRQALVANPAFLLLDPTGITPAVDALLTKEAGSTPLLRIAPPARWVDREGVRFILLGSAGGSLRTNQFKQLAEFRTALDLSRLDSQVRRVVVISQESPLRFTDKREGDLVADWLVEFEEKSGKQAIYLASGGQGLGVQRVDGIPYIEAGSPNEPLHFTIDLNPPTGNPWFRFDAR